LRFCRFSYIETAPKTGDETEEFVFDLEEDDTVEL